MTKILNNDTLTVRLAAMRSVLRGQERGGIHCGTQQQPKQIKEN
jgi:hypothetical protein